MSWENIPGWCDEWLCAEYDAAIERAQDGAVFVELGVAFGKSLTYAAGRVAASGKRIQLFGVDTFEPADWLLRACGDIIAKHGSMVRSAMFFAPAEALLLKGTTEHYAKFFSEEGVEPRRFDFVFVDADHSYEGVLADLRAWWPLVRPGGAMAGHDHTGSFPGVERACREFFGGDYEIHGTCWRRMKT